MLLLMCVCVCVYVLAASEGPESSLVFHDQRYAYAELSSSYRLLFYHLLCVIDVM